MSRIPGYVLQKSGSVLSILMHVDMGSAYMRGLLEDFLKDAAGVLFGKWSDPHQMLRVEHHSSSRIGLVLFVVQVFQQKDFSHVVQD